ncbi:MAG: rRNA maturation RNase YbeY [Candidatus Nealsonbacteria bacterium CG_4_10_14_0_2_um_filter_37_10]|uniref:Endoribonuclease YbeY n=2 Tax=Candidatus Nealsoniibacteriota TaxID=1817911 RepID=A0A2M7V071_9BACT|nr:MAG: rRNA maturation RNase YbeY [Candidatus Nealsonbacteria bacterium CG_4_10_14_0_2_um_filter_37_10]PJA84657.1 MAG: rRNA maturation RNase YbeY [Candidatus Nealsonbacteria bacterium CG_4_9_14_3_um_filter_37_13]
MIEINNLTTTPIEEEILKKVAEKILEGENKRNTDLSIALVGPGRIRKLNKKYRGKNRVTDVLSFPDNGLGEIVICLREVKKNAKKFGSSFKKELSTCLIHGILHLLGYDHEKSVEEVKKMRDREEYYLSQV